MFKDLMAEFHDCYGKSSEARQLPGFFNRVIKRFTAWNPGRCQSLVCRWRFHRRSCGHYSAGQIPAFRRKPARQGLFKSEAPPAEQKEQKRTTKQDSALKEDPGYVLSSQDNIVVTPHRPG